MLEIYIKETPIWLCSLTEANVFKDVENTIVIEPGNKDKLFSIIESIENGKIANPMIVLSSSDFEQLKTDFFSYYKLMQAAGGLVFNSEKKVLAIYRNGFWDLPKGKIDKGESSEDAAVREVQEETGLSQISLGNFLCHTYHTYLDPRKNRRVLKITDWYLMHSIQVKLTAQAEEGIELALWIDPEELRLKTPIYRNILTVLKNGKSE